MDNITIRELQKEDIQNGFLTTLDSLKQASNIGKNKAEKIFETINANPHHTIIIAEREGKVIGSATLLIELKFIHDGGLVGHIEDVVVDKNFQRQKIGEKMIKHILKIAENRECYKTILDCAVEIQPFYEKLGFKHVTKGLRFNHI